MDKGIPPANAKATVDRNGFNKGTVEDGDLMDAITHVVKTGKF